MYIFLYGFNIVYVIIYILIIFGWQCDTEISETFIYMNTYLSV